MSEHDKEHPLHNDSDLIGTDYWWLKGTRGATLPDRLTLSFLKLVFIGTRFSLRIILGRKARDAFFKKRSLNFKDFLYKAISPFGLARLLLEIKVPKYDYKIHCPLNKEDFIVMTRHEDEIIKLFTPKQGDVVVDIGAHMGRYTIIGARRTGPAGKVIAIEAHPNNFKLLNRNIKLNKLLNIITLNTAAYSKKTRLRLYVPLEAQGYTMHHSVMANYLATKYNNVERKYVEVEANTLDNLLRMMGIDRVNWIKIDVEGAEFQVLKGADETLSENNDISLLVEVHGKETYLPVLDFLKSHNFKIEFETTYENGEKHIIATKKK